MIKIGDDVILTQEALQDKQYSAFDKTYRVVGMKKRLFLLYHHSMPNFLLEIAECDLIKFERSRDEISYKYFGLR